MNTEERDWSEATWPEVVAEYERRKAFPGVTELWQALGITKQSFHSRLSTWYRRREALVNRDPGDEQDGAA